ncbi:hypothetical protein WDU94_000484 [Cyamophila willieti]
MKRHDGYRPFACDLCGRTFTQSYHYKNHMAIHSNTNPNVCVLCDKSFSDRGSLNRHRKKVHKLTRNVPTRSELEAAQRMTAEGALVGNATIVMGNPTMKVPSIGNTFPTTSSSGVLSTNETEMEMNSLHSIGKTRFTNDTTNHDVANDGLTNDIQNRQSLTNTTQSRMSDENEAQSLTYKREKTLCDSTLRTNEKIVTDIDSTSRCEKNGVVKQLRLGEDNDELDKRTDVLRNDLREVIHGKVFEDEVSKADSLDRDDRCEVSQQIDTGGRNRLENDNNILNGNNISAMSDRTRKSEVSPNRIPNGNTLSRCEEDISESSVHSPEENRSSASENTLSNRSLNMSSEEEEEDSNQLVSYGTLEPMATDENGLEYLEKVGKSLKGNAGFKLGETSSGFKGKSIEMRDNNVKLKGNSSDLRDNSIDMRDNNGELRGNSSDLKGKSVDMRDNDLDLREDSLDYEEDEENEEELSSGHGTEEYYAGYERVNYTGSTVDPIQYNSTLSDYLSQILATCRR